MPVYCRLSIGLVFLLFIPVILVPLYLSIYVSINSCYVIDVSYDLSGDLDG